MGDKIDSLIKSLESLSVVEMVQVCEKLRELWNVGQLSVSEEGREEKDDSAALSKIRINSIGDAKLKLFKALQSNLNWDLAKFKSSTSSLPVDIDCGDVDKAKSILTQLKEIGVDCELC